MESSLDTAEELIKAILSLVPQTHTQTKDSVRFRIFLREDIGSPLVLGSGSGQLLTRSKWASRSWDILGELFRPERCN